MADFDPDAYLSGGDDTPRQGAPTSSFDPDAFLAGDNGAAPQPDAGTDRNDRSRDAGVAPEGALARGVRNVAHGVPAAVGGFAGAGAGAELGAAAGATLGPVGAAVGGVVGGIAGAFAGGYGGEKIAHAAQDLTGINDDEQFAANQEAHPTEAALEQAIPAFAGMRFDKGASLLARAASGGMQGGIDAAQQYANTGDVKPAEVLAIAAAGAVFPGVNKVGAAIEGAGRSAGSKFVPGRPGRTADPAANQAHADVGDDTVETAVGDSSLAESPPRPTGATVGAPAENSPTNSRGEVATGAADPSYAKGTPPAAPGNDMLTQGDMDPATKAALDVANPQQAPGMDQPQGESAPAQAEPQPAAPPEAQAQQPVAPQQQPVVEAGFPQPGEPVATGANDATPMPADMPAKAAAAIKRSKSAQDVTAPAVKENKVSGKTVPNASLSDAQKEAGNYPKEHSHDFGKPTSTETAAGDIRKGKAPDGTEWEVKMPYDYGYFNKTKSTDGDGIDWARPKVDAPERGDKHFIIDQRNPETGEYDEPKVFRDVKDKMTAIDLYNRAFSDGKGPSRMHDVTEVSRPDLVKYLKKHTDTAPTKPYGAPMPKAPKPIAERAVVKDAIQKLEAKGDVEAAEKLRNAPQEAVAALAGKRVRKYGVETGASAGYPVEGLVNNEGKPVTANTKMKAQERSAKHKEVTNWFEGSKPPSQMDVSKETPGETLDRIKKGLTDLSGWSPSFKPKEWMLAREAKRVLAKPTPKAIENFREAERLLRGDDAAVDTYRGGNRVEADVARNKRGGEENVSRAEAAMAEPHSEEDKMIAAIDAKRGGRFDVPHEEAESMVTPTAVKTSDDLKKLPRKTIDVKDSSLAKVDLKKVDESAAAKRRAEAEALAGKKSKASTAESEGAAGGVRKIKVHDPAEMQRLIEMSNKAAKRASLSDDEIAQHDLTKQKAVKPSDGGAATAKRLFEQFSDDERGSLDLNKIKADLKKLLQTTPVKSYIARTPNAKAEPHADYTRGLSEELHKVSQADKSHRLNLLEQAAALPKEADKAALERIYDAREADSAHIPLPAGATSHVENLSPSDKKIYDDHLKHVFDENDKFYDAMTAAGHDLGPRVESHVARITKGKTSEFNMLKDKDDPTGPQYNGLSVNAMMANKRPFVALERVSDGQRFVVQNRDSGFTKWENHKAERIKDPNWEFEANAPYTVKGKGGDVDYIMREATSKEIENSGARLDLGRDKNGKVQTQPVKYYKNAALSAYMTHAQMGSMARHLAELARISSTPEFKEMTTTNRKLASERGWQESKLPNFEGTYMDPQLKYVMDDYAKPGFDSPQILRDLNQGVTKLLFWMPTAHIANVGAHWFVGRGFDNANVKSLFENGAKAIRSVMKQDEYQKALRDAGAGTIYPSVKTRGFMDKMASAVSEEMIHEPSKWGPIADKIGVPLKKLSDAIYNASSHVMWATNDVFLTQRVMELEGKGHSMEQAIKMAERDIPNYRLPTTVMGSGQKARVLQQIMADPMVSSFGRYHYGMFNSYANIIKDAVGKDASVGDRLDAAGKMMAMGLLAYGVYPVLDKFAKMVTGNEDATENRRGPLSIPYHLNRAAQGKEDIASAGRSTLTIPPFWSTVMESLSNKDWRGKQIVEPGDVAAGMRGDAFRGGRAIVQEAEHAARGLISPLGTFSTAEKKYKDDNPAIAAGKAVRDQSLDIRNPSQAASNYERKQDIYNERSSRQRDKKGGYGPLEQGYDKLFGH